jgi:UDPglucose 6-dehydrogenase
MKIGMIGKGTVGSAVYRGLGELGHVMSFVDPAYPETKFSDILDTDVVFVCVPTDRAANGDCDTSIVEQVMNDLDTANYTGLVAIKSSVIPGTADRLSAKHSTLKICSVPEFLRARCAYEDFVEHQDLLVIGSVRDEDYDIIKETHGHYPKNISCVKPAEAEVVKYFNNVNHSVQIIFANITYEICKSLGVDYQNVYNAIIKRECFNPAYLDCSENLRGFGGHCLPKDTSAYANLIKQLGLNYALIDATLKDNESFTK